MDKKTNSCSSEEEKVMMKQDKDEEERGMWGNQCEFFLSCLGYAVGFGNVWRFPYLAYKNGGAAFLIPYFTMLLCAGLPLFFMELVLGQYTSLGPNIIFPKMTPILTGIGWGMIIVSALVTIYYNVILAWALFYIFASFTSELPWTGCHNDFNTPECYLLQENKVCKNMTMFYYNQSCLEPEAYCGLVNLASFNDSHCFDPNDNDSLVVADGAVRRLTPSEDYYRNRVLRVTGKTWKDMGGMQWELVGCLAVAWLLVFACMVKGIKSSGKVVYFTALFPYVVLIILFVRGITLEGASLGIDYYLLKPDLSRLADSEVWSDAAIQIFFSFGLSFGGLITLASYNKYENNCMRDAIVISLANCSTSVFAGFVIFSILGFLAHELGVEVEDVVSSGSGLAFVVYPAAVTRMPVAPLWSLLFFAMLITLGLDSQFTTVETVTTAILDQFHSLRSRRPLVVGVTCLLLFFMGLTMCLEGGVYMFELFFFYSSGLSVIILSITEIVAVQYIYGFRNFFRHITEDMGITVPRPLYAYWLLTWCAVTPLVLLAILVFSVIYFVPAYWDDYVFPLEIQVLGWLILFSTVIMVPLGMIYALMTNSGCRKDLLVPTPDFCPAHVRQERRRGQVNSACVNNDAPVVTLHL
ncbi:sodium- and chloride-dependent glycine transporter 1-like [Portunus trituberculatus]|nr:sodium- and chloride-dependent glycine transporter 1-like [Portunus trituberculatus]